MTVEETDSVRSFRVEVHDVLTKPAMRDALAAIRNEGANPNLTSGR